MDKGIALSPVQLATIREYFNLPADAQLRKSFYRARVRVLGADHKPTGETKRVQKVRIEHFRPGVMKNPPRMMRSAVTKYLRTLEANTEAFDAATVRQFKGLRKLYATLHIEPSALADSILFKNNPPEGSKRHIMRRIASIEDPTEWAKAVVAAKLPYPVASGLLSGEMTPVHLIALIAAMSPQELLNNVGSLKERGALDNPEVKKLVDAKLENAAKANRVDALKAQKAVRQVGAQLDDDTVKLLQNVTDTQVSRSVEIKKNTVLAIDASGSMDRSIEIGKELGSLIAPCCKGEFMCVTFSGTPVKHDIKSNKKSDWDLAFRLVRASGRTEMQGVVALMRRTSVRWDQIVLVTDEGDNGSPSFASALNQYQRDMGYAPNVVIVRVASSSGGATTMVEKALRANDLSVDVVDLTATRGVDYYSLPNVLPLLAGGSMMDLTLDIMELPLPSRKAYDSRV